MTGLIPKGNDGLSVREVLIKVMGGLLPLTSVAPPRTQSLLVLRGRGTDNLQSFTSDKFYGQPAFVTKY